MTSLLVSLALSNNFLTNIKRRQLGFMMPAPLHKSNLSWGVLRDHPQIMSKSTQKAWGKSHPKTRKIKQGFIRTWLYFALKWCVICMIFCDLHDLTWQKWPFSSISEWSKCITGTDFSASNHQGGHQQLSRWVRTKSFLPNTKCFFKDIKYGPWSTWPTLSRCFLSPLLCQINLELAQITLVLFLIYLQTLHSIACEGTSSGKV